MALPNYITEINKFYDWLETNQLPKSAIALWHGLMHINNKAGWDQRFTVAISTIESKTGFKRSELFEARNILEQKGRLNWKQRGGNLCAEYELKFFSVHNTDAKANTVPDTSADAKANTKPTQTGTINKQEKEKTKLNQTTSSAPQADAPRKKKEDDFSTIPFWKAFVETWDGFYQLKTAEKYLYAKKDFGCLKNVYQFLQKRSEQKKFDFTEENLVNAFQFFLKAAYEKDDWLRRNFSIPNILSQFNQIAKDNGQPGSAKAKQPTGGSVSTASAFDAIDKHFGEDGKT